jgi:hypothetical protein
MSRDVLQKIDHLKANGEFYIISLLPMRPFPKAYSKQINILNL